MWFLAEGIINNEASETWMSFLFRFPSPGFTSAPRNPKEKQLVVVVVVGALLNVMISTDTDQYQRIYCNICGRIAQPQCDVFDRAHRLVRSEALQHRCIGTQPTVSTSDEIECEMQLVLLALLPSCSGVHL